MTDGQTETQRECGSALTLDQVRERIQATRIERGESAAKGEYLVYAAHHERAGNPPWPEYDSVFTPKTKPKPPALPKLPAKLPPRPGLEPFRPPRSLYMKYEHLPAAHTWRWVLFDGLYPVAFGGPHFGVSALEREAAWAIEHFFGRFGVRLPKPIPRKTEDIMGHALATLKAKAEHLHNELLIAAPQITVAIPAGLPMNALQIIRITETEVRKNPELLNCSATSLVRAVIEVCQLGLSLDKRLQQASLIPFGKQVQVIPGYRGLEALAYRSGKVSVIRPYAVYQKDKYRYEEGLDEVLEHTPYKGEDRGPLVAVYAIAKMTDGNRDHEWMWKHQVDKIRDKAPGKNSDAWRFHYDEMAKKTAIRRLCKHLPVDTVQRAAELQEQTEMGIEQQLLPSFTLGSDPVDGGPIDDGSLNVESFPADSPETAAADTDPPPIVAGPNVEELGKMLADCKSQKACKELAARYPGNAHVASACEERWLAIKAERTAKQATKQESPTEEPEKPPIKEDPQVAGSRSRKAQLLDRIDRAAGPEVIRQTIMAEAVEWQGTGDLLPPDFAEVERAAESRIKRMRGE